MFIDEQIKHNIILFLKDEVNIGEFIAVDSMEERGEFLFVCKRYDEMLSVAVFRQEDVYYFKNGNLLLKDFEYNIEGNMIRFFLKDIGSLTLENI